MPLKLKPVSEQTIVITGGGSGLGRCTAHELAHLGADVVITGRSADKLDAVVQEIRAEGGSCSGLVCDIRDEVAVQATVLEVRSRAAAYDGPVVDLSLGAPVDATPRVVQDALAAAARA